MATVPTLPEILNSPSQSQSPLAKTLSVLFEPSPILLSTLEPQLTHLFPTIPAITSYSQLIDVSLAQIARWDKSLQAQFIAGHPRIGESKNLSNLSAKEQGASSVVAPTPPEVLARLAHLNECYEQKYPGLRYITFVNGRSRAVIAEEMADKLGLNRSLSSTEPVASSIEPEEVEGEEWSLELERAIRDIGLIAKSRLSTLGVV